MTYRQVLTLLGAIGFTIPFVWMVGVSVLTATGEFSIARGIDNYLDVWNSGSFGRYFLNSLIVSTALTAGNVLFCSMGGYVFSRKSFPGKKILFFTVMMTLIVPAQLIMVPLYILMVKWNWLDTYWALIVPWLVNPFGIFLMKQFFDQLPKEIEESARMDGSGDWRILFRIVMPMARPALAILAIYVFIGSWNQFLFPFLFVDSDAMRTLPVGLAFYSGYQDIDVPHLMAGASISAVPMIAAFALFQKQIISGMTAGAVKG